MTINKKIGIAAVVLATGIGAAIAGASASAGKEAAIKSFISTEIEQSGEFKSFNYDVEAGLFGNSLELVNISAVDNSGMPLKIESIGISDYSPFDGGSVPENFTLEVENFHLPANVWPDKETTRQLLDAMGYNLDQLFISLNYRHSLKEGRMSPAITLSSGDAGEVSLKAELSGVDLQAPAVVALSPQNMAKLKFSRFELSFKDNTVADRFLGALAKLRGKSTPEKEKERFRRLLVGSATGWFGSQQKRILAGLNAFVDDPSSLKISIVPHQPVTLPELMFVTERPDVVLPTLEINVSS